MQKHIYYPKEYDVIVVGAGFGGASCAGLLAKRGRKVLLLEKNAKAGGKAMAFSKDGFTYTPWVVITAPIMDNVFARVLKELGVEAVSRPLGGLFWGVVIALGNVIIRSPGRASAGTSGKNPSSTIASSSAISAAAF